MNQELMDKIKKVKEKYRVLKKESLNSKSKYLDVMTIRYILNNSKIKDMDLLTKNGKNGDAVVIIPILDNGNILMIIESRPVIDEEVAVEFPAGMVDNNEEPINAAIRELEEETGYYSNDIRKIECHYQDQGCSRAIIRTYLALNCRKISEQHLDDKEDIELLEVTLEELEGLLNDGNYIMDANTKIAAYTYIKKK